MAHRIDVNNLSTKTETELQSILDDAHNFTSQNAYHETAKLINVLLVVAERDKRYIGKIEFKNSIYTYIIIELSVTAIVAQILPLILKWAGVLE